MKTILKVLLTFISISFTVTPQHYDYWKNAPAGGSKIYSIFFTDQQNGYAVSTDSEIFITTDSGAAWNLSNTENDIIKSNVNEKFWSAEIYCSVMQTTDGGMNWLPYSKEKQDHFCRVYLKDPNVEYKTASEFLNIVTSKILFGIREDALATLEKQPQQCTEYYTSENEGWAIGWCSRNIKVNIDSGKNK